MPEYKCLDLILAGRCISIERLPADCTILCSGWHYHVAVGADMRFEGGLLFLLLGILKAVDPPQLPLDVLPGKMGIGAEHLGMDRAPHDQLDNTFRDPLLNHVRDP